MNDTPGGFGRYVARIALMLAILVVLVAAGWTWLTLSWAYSVGERAGVLQKFSRKGWMCKTHEGELAQYVVGGVAPQIWYFSVRDAAVADQMFKVVGQNVQVRYREHRGIPTNCFGDTPYFAESFTIVPPATR
ncbi:MAG TPA: hypothetical protein VHC93_26085 [Methylomirabilota bacterium]|nr:hypothetical protein [Methylomirabilota bacterium]